MDKREQQRIIDKFTSKYPETKNDKFIYRMDRDCIEWICPKHGIGHPIWDAYDNYVHDCCGCCKRFKDWVEWRDKE